MSDNLKLWNKVSKSDPQYLKKVSFGSRSFTAIDPQYQVRCATEAFGVIGHGWGWTNETRFVDLQGGDTAVVADVSIWTGTREPKSVLLQICCHTHLYVCVYKDT